MPSGPASLARVCVAAVVCLFAPSPGSAQPASGAAAAQPGTGTGTGSISGVIVDAGSGAPLERARVSLDGVRGRRTLSNPHGRFLLADLPAAGLSSRCRSSLCAGRRDVDLRGGTSS